MELTAEKHQKTLRFEFTSSHNTAEPKQEKNPQASVGISIGATLNLLHLPVSVAVADPRNGVFDAAVQDL